MLSAYQAEHKGEVTIVTMLWSKRGRKRSEEGKTREGRLRAVGIKAQHPTPKT
jgi:hypothetical protein